MVLTEALSFLWRLMEIIGWTLWRGVKRGLPWAAFAVALPIVSLLVTRVTKGPEYDWFWVARHELWLWVIIPVATIITFVVHEITLGSRR